MIATIPGPGVISNIHFVWGHTLLWNPRTFIMDVAKHCVLASGTVNGQVIFNLPLDISLSLFQEGVGDLDGSIGLV